MALRPIKVESEACAVSSSLNAGALVFVDPMRDRQCMTMLDPFHAKYGKAVTTAMSLVSLFLDVIWVPTTLTGLGRVHLARITAGTSSHIIFSHK